MRYTDGQIRQAIQNFIDETAQPEAFYVIGFCVGYFECITPQIYRVIFAMRREGIIQ